MVTTWPKNYPGVGLGAENLSKLVNKMSAGRLQIKVYGSGELVPALEVFDDSILSHLPNLKVISKFGVGLDMIDLHTLKKYGIKLGWTGGVNKRSVSELVISFAVTLLHRVVFANSEVRNGKWYQVKGRQLSDCTFGIIGCGHIGKDLIKLLKPFNCKILAHDILNFKEFYEKNN